MNASQLEQLKTMSHAARASHYLKKLIAKEITRQQYDDILEVVLRLPYITTVSQGDEIRRDSGEQREEVARVPEYEPIADSGGTMVPITQDAFVASLERVDITPLPTATDGRIEHTKAHKAEIVETTSQKQRLLTLLSDYEWHPTPQIQVAVYGANHLGIARVAARINDLKNDGHDIESRKVTQAIWEYRLVEKAMKWIGENILSG